MDARYLYGTFRTSSWDSYTGYFPPEVFRDNHWGPEVDVYATGMCVIHLLSGCQPYGELENEAAVLEALLAVSDRENDDQ